mmetsp:Transcript_16024/g.17925  ORF Transcript_16024/g.17925 Transcript_16024/m.17925 type:complete len:93 (+) Transcript_16024:1629-1907(+)
MTHSIWISNGLYLPSKPSQFAYRVSIQNWLVNKKSEKIFRASDPPFTSLFSLFSSFTCVFLAFLSYFFVISTSIGVICEVERKKPNRQIKIW